MRESLTQDICAKEAFVEFARGGYEYKGPWQPEHDLPGGRDDRRHDHYHDRHQAPAPPQPNRHHQPNHGGGHHGHYQDRHHDPHHGGHQPPRHEERYDHHSGSAPRFAPPSYVPKAAPGLRAVDPGAISRCLYSYTYLWLNNRQEFWFFPTFVGRKSVAGYRWMHGQWVYMGFDLKMIDSFFCGGR